MVLATLEPSPSTDLVARWVQFADSTEGRDKATKVLQYFFKALTWGLSKFPLQKPLRGLFFLDFQDAALRSARFSVACADARKIFRLARSLHEYVKVRHLIRSLRKASSSGSTPTLWLNATTLDIISRSSYLGYWFFDSLFILMKTGAIRRGNAAKVSRHAAFFWFWGLVLSLSAELVRLRELRSLRQLHIAECDQCIANGNSGITPVRILEPPQAGSCNALGGVLQLQRTSSLNIVKNLGDLVTASNMLQIPRMLSGFSVPDGVVGLSGLLSALISCKQLFPAATVPSKPT